MVWIPMPSVSSHSAPDVIGQGSIKGHVQDMTLATASSTAARQTTAAVEHHATYFCPLAR